MTLSAFLISGKVKVDGDIIRLLLRRKKIKQKVVAEYLKIAPPQLIRYLNGEYPIPQPLFAKLLKLLGLTDPSLILFSEVTAPNE